MTSIEVFELIVAEPYDVPKIAGTPCEACGQRRPLYRAWIGKTWTEIWVCQKCKKSYSR